MNLKHDDHDDTYAIEYLTDLISQLTPFLKNEEMQYLLIKMLEDVYDD